MAIGFHGGPKSGFFSFSVWYVGFDFFWGCVVVLVDECTSGVDPLSRRALRRTLTFFREDRTIILTTHICGSSSCSRRVLTTLVIQFLDEADLLADHIAILAAPGKLIASGSPVSLKRDLGYSVRSLRQWRKGYIRVKRPAAP